MLARQHPSCVQEWTGLSGVRFLRKPAMACAVTCRMTDTGSTPHRVKAWPTALCMPRPTVVSLQPASQKTSRTISSSGAFSGNAKARTNSLSVLFAFLSSPAKYELQTIFNLPDDSIGDMTCPFAQELPVQCENLQDIDNRVLRQTCITASETNVSRGGRQPQV